MSDVELLIYYSIRMEIKNGNKELIENKMYVASCCHVYYQCPHGKAADIQMYYHN